MFSWVKKLSQCGVILDELHFLKELWLMAQGYVRVSKIIHVVLIWEARIREHVMNVTNEAYLMMIEK